MTNKETGTETKKVHDTPVIKSLTRSMKGLYMDLLSKFLHGVITDGSATLQKTIFSAMHDGDIPGAFRNSTGIST